MASISRQFEAVLIKNAKLQRRNPFGLVLQFLMPILVVLIACLYVFVFNNLLGSHQPAVFEFEEFPITRLTMEHTALQSCVISGDCVLGIAPDTLESRELGLAISNRIKNLGDVANIPPVFYSTEDELQRAYSGDFRGKFFGAITFKKSNSTHNLPSGFGSDYSILMNASFLPSVFLDPRPIARAYAYTSNASLYVSSGLTTIQNAIDGVLAARAAADDFRNITASFMNVTASLLPTKERGNPFGMVLAMLVSVVLILASVPYVVIGISNVAYERKTRMRESLFISGLSPYVYWASWIVTLSIPALLTAFVTLIAGFSVGLFQGTNPLLVISIFVAFSASCVTFSLLAPILVSNGAASLVIGFCWLYIPSQMMPFLPASTVVYHALYFIAPVDMYLSAFEIITTSMHSTAVGAAHSVVSLEKLLIFLIVDSCIYAILAWYFHQIFPGECGVAKHPLFPFQKSYWCPRKRLIDEEKGTLTTPSTSAPSQIHSTKSLRMFQMINGGTSASLGITCMGLKVEYKSAGGMRIHGLNGLNATFERGRSTAILGHEGSGRSSLINVLGGLVKPVSGDAFISGLSIRENMNEIRQMIGICPEHDVLYETLTASDHLELIGALKGMPKEQCKIMANEMLNHVGLSNANAKKEQISKFSVGMKRKLSIAMALFGDPDVVLFDEPTEGCDAQTRRYIWQIIEKHKAERTVIVTTSSMKEADILCDSIFIISSGKMKCGGTPEFLKKQFGVGYYLTFEKKEQSPQQQQQKEHETSTSQLPMISKLTENVNLIIKKHVPESMTVGQGKIQLPYGCESNLPRALIELESNADQLGITNIGISLTTLDDLFLKLGVQDADVEEQFEVPSPQFSQPNIGDSWVVNSTLGSFSHSDEEIPLVLPAITRKTLTIKTKLFGQLRGLSRQKLLFFKRHWLTTLSMIILPPLLLFTFVFSLKFGQNDYIVPSKNPSGSLIDIYSFSPVDIPYTVEQNTVNMTDLELLLNSVSVPEKLTFTLFESPKALRNHTLNVGGYLGAILFHSLSIWDEIFEATYLYNDTRPYSIIALQNILDVAVLRAYSNNSAAIPVHFKSLNGQDRRPPALVDATIVYACMALAGGLLVAEGMFFGNIINERENGFKTQLILSGANPFVICFVNICSGALSLVPAILLSTTIIWAMQVTSTAAVLIPFFITCILFALVMASLNYCISFFIHSAEGSAGWVVLTEFFIAIIPWAVKTLLSVIELGSLDLLNAIISYSTDIIPMCAFVSAIIDACHTPVWARVKDVFKFGFKKEMIIAMFCLLLSTIFFNLLAYYLEYREDFTPKSEPSLPTLQQQKSKEDKDKKHGDEEVLSETARIDSGSADGDAVVIKHLEKVFTEGSTDGTPDSSVLDLSFSVSHGQLFVLLGPTNSNSTVLQMLAGEIRPTSGTVLMDGKPLSGRISHVQHQQMVSYMPQEDSILECLTGREHLEILYTIYTCHNSNAVKAEVNSAIVQSGMTVFADRRVASYTSGMRRKLCVAMSLLPGKLVVLLDSPTAGMNINARHELWDALRKEQSAGRTIILATPLLEEAEAVGTRVGIISDGILQCIGTMEHLKEKYNKGYHLTVELEDEDDTDACDELVSRITESGDVVVTEVCGNWRTYRLGRVRSIASLFELLERVKEQYGIASYEVTQTSLEWMAS